MKGERQRSSFNQHYSRALRALVYGWRRFQTAPHVPWLKISGGPGLCHLTRHCRSPFEYVTGASIQRPFLSPQACLLQCPRCAPRAGSLARSPALPFHQQITRRFLWLSDLPQACD